MYPPAGYRYNRFGFYFRKTMLGLGLLLALLALLFFRPMNAAALTALKDGGSKMPGQALAAYFQQEPLRLLQQVFPVLRWSDPEQEPATPDLSQSLWEALEMVARVDLYSPVSILKSQMPLPLTPVAVPETVLASRSGAVHSLEPAPVSDVSDSLPGESVVLLYNTHTGETYSMTDRVERLDGRQGGIVTVAAVLQAALEERHGIKTARSDRIHDANYDTAYLESGKTAREMLELSPEARLVLDIHRDAAKTREQSIVKVRGEEVAPLLIVVGSGTRNSPNYAFAIMLSTKINELYPGLSLGVRLHNSSYNQQLHPRSLLIEVGTSQNALEEAVRAAEMLADVIARVLAEEDEEGLS